MSFEAKQQEYRNPDQLHRWVPMTKKRKYHIINGRFLQVVALSTNSEFLLRIVDQCESLIPYEGEFPAIFQWEIVVEEGSKRCSDAVSVIKIDSLSTVYFGQKSCFALSAEARYAAGFLLLPTDEAEREKLTEKFVSYLSDYSIDALNPLTSSTKETQLH